MIKHGNFMEYLYHPCYIFPKMAEYSTTFIVSNLWIWLDHDERIISRLLHFKGVIWIIGEVVSSTPTNFFLEKETLKMILFIEILKNIAAMMGAAGLPFLFCTLNKYLDSKLMDWPTWSDGNLVWSRGHDANFSFYSDDDLET